MTGWKENNEYFTKKYKLIRDYPYENSEMVSSTFDQYDIKYVLDDPNSWLVAFLVDKGWNIVQKSDRTILLQKN